MYPECSKRDQGHTHRGKLLQRKCGQCTYVVCAKANARTSTIFDTANTVVLCITHVTNGSTGAVLVSMETVMYGAAWNANKIDCDVWYCMIRDVQIILIEMHGTAA